MKKIIQTLQQLVDRKELNKTNKRKVSQMILNAKFENEKNKK